jgi:nitrogen fixation protein FixH
MTALVSPWSGRAWAWAPALILVGLIGTQLVVLGNVLHDPAFATEPDYYQKSVDWDTLQAQRRQSNALGWQSTLSADSTAAPARTRFQLRLQDGLGRAVTGARLRAVAFHNARASRAFDLRFEETAQGSYEAELDSDRPGLWELRLRGTLGADGYERVFRVDLEPAQGAR